MFNPLSRAKITLITQRYIIKIGTIHSNFDLHRYIKSLATKEYPHNKKCKWGSETKNRSSYYHRIITLIVIQKIRKAIKKLLQKYIVIKCIYYIFENSKNLKIQYYDTIYAYKRGEQLPSTLKKPPCSYIIPSYITRDT